MSYLSSLQVSKTDATMAPNTMPLAYAAQEPGFTWNRPLPSCWAGGQSAYFALLGFAQNVKIIDIPKRRRPKRLVNVGDWSILLTRKDIRRNSATPKHRSADRGHRLGWGLTHSRPSGRFYGWITMGAGVATVPFSGGYRGI